MHIVSLVHSQRVESKKMSVAQNKETKRTEAKAHRHDYRYHFNVIADTISQIIDRTHDKAFRNDAKSIIKMRTNDVKAMQRHILKRIDANYDDAPRRESK